MSAIIRSRKPGRGEKTRQRIIRQSAPLFNQHGYAGTTMSELMAATGLEKGGLYRHFESKQSLAAAAFDYAWQAVSAPRRRGLENCASNLDKLLLFIQNFVEEIPRAIPGGCPLLNTALDSDNGDPVLREKACEALAEWRSFIAGLIRAGQASGELSKHMDPNAVAVVLIGTLEGAVMIGRLEKSREPLRTVGKHLEQYLRSIQTAAA